MKSKRQSKIKELVQSHEIETQLQLTAKLQASGFTAAQATISRDIHELKLTKIPAAAGGYKYALPRQEQPENLARLVRIFKDGFVSMDYAGNILVIRTFNGMAMAVAAAVDSMGLSEVVGSLAGDDVVFCAVKNEEQAMNLMKKLKKVQET